MRAMLCQAFGPPEQLTLGEVPSPTPGPGQVTIRVGACDVNFPDTLVIQGKYQFQPPFPFTPGSDVAGTIAAVGPGVTDLAVGERVCAFVGFGGYAEEVVADAALTLRLPDAVDFAAGASFLMTYATAYHALLDRGRLRAGETLLVLGAGGGVGTAAIELGRALGARVIAAASSDAKLAACRELGATATINYATESLRDRLKALAPDGVDVAYDPVGGDLAEPALRAMGWDGRYLVIGFAAGDIPRIPLNLTLLKGCAVVGVFLGGFMRRDPAGLRQRLSTLLEWIADGTIQPRVATTYPLAEAPRALRALADRQVIGKVVLLP